MLFRDHGAAVATTTIASSLNCAFCHCCNCFSTPKRLGTGHWQLQILPALHTAKCQEDGPCHTPDFWLIWSLLLVYNVIPLSELKPPWGKMSWFLFIFQPVAQAHSLFSKHTSMLEYSVLKIFDTVILMPWFWLIILIPHLLQLNFQCANHKQLSMHSKYCWRTGSLPLAICHRQPL